MNTDFAKLALASLFAISALAGAGCAAIEHNAQEGDTVQGEDAIRSRATWFRVKASGSSSSPYFVRAADSGTIACPGGTAGSFCSLNEIDYGALRMPADDISEIDTLARAGNLLIQGRLSRTGALVKLTVASAYEDVLNNGTAYYHKTCDHVYVKPTSDPDQYRRGDRLMGAPYNDAARFWTRIETSSYVIMDARDLVAAGLVGAKGQLICMGQDAGMPAFSAVLLNVKDTYAP